MKNINTLLSKYGQMGVGIRVKFTTPQYFAKLAKSIFNIDDKFSAEIYHDHVTFLDGSGTLDSKGAKQEISKLLEKIEDKLNLDRGELFNYDFEYV